MTPSEKRAAARKIEEYIDSLHQNGEARTITHSEEWLKAKIKELQGSLKDPNKTWLQKVKLLQRIRDYEYELSSQGPDLRQGFVEVALQWSEEHYVEAETWLDFKVPRSVLKEAGF